MYAVRRGEDRDIPAIMKLLVQVNMVHHRGRPDLFKGPATKYTEAELAAILREETTPVFVCVQGDRVLGHAFCIFRQARPDDPLMTEVKTLYIDDICVDELCRGQGVGKALYDHVLSFARERGCYNVTLNVWSCNPGARGFYEAMGMVPQKIGMEVLL